MPNNTDQHYMQLALSLAKRGLYTCAPNPRVGCVMVNHGRVVAEGWHQQTGQAHAETNALALAGEQADQATCYVTLEPCCHHGRTPPCVDALINAGIKRVVIAMRDPNPQVAGKGIAALRQQGIEVIEGICQEQAEAINVGFSKRMRYGLPWVRAKLAISLDGRIAMTSGESQWITSPAARDDGQHWRARSSAIMTGMGSLLADDPKLTVRLYDVRQQPYRVVVDSQLRTPINAQLLQQSGKTLIFTCSDDQAKADALQQAGAEIIMAPSMQQRVDLRYVMQQLAELACNEVHIEAGGILTGALLQQGLIDEMLIYIAPIFLGHAAKPMLQLPGLTHLAEALQCQYQAVEKLGDDLRVQILVAKGKDV